MAAHGPDIAPDPTLEVAADHPAVAGDAHSSESQPSDADRIAFERDTALSCTQKLMLEAAALAEELQGARLEAAELRSERDQLQRRVEELSAELEEAKAEREERSQEPEASAANLALENAAAGAAASFLALDAWTADATVSTALPATEYLIGDENDAFFSASAKSSDAPVLFLLQKGVAALEYRVAEEVVELHQSINFTYVSPEGRGQESCKGYVFYLKREGVPRIFAALCGVESGNTWIYAPDEQPETDEDASRYLQSGLDFAEEVGLLMEPLIPAPSQPQHLRVISSCPVLRAA
jgi:hypothetical protein